MPPIIPEPTCCSAPCRFRRDRIANGIAQCRRSLALDRNLADAHGFIGLGKYQSGQSEEVEGHIQEALRLSPRDTRAFLWFMFVGLGKLSINADREAVDWFRRSLEAQPKSRACLIFTLLPRWRWWGT